MHIKRLLPFLVSLAIIPITLRAGEVPGDSTDNGKAQTRPKAGLVLAGGGTSMGSIIGGLYALGYTPEEMDEIIKNVDWSQILGNNVENTFNDLSAGYQDSIDFRSLPIPFACVTTNMLDGSETVLSSGKISQAMRSSMAIPIIFAPMEYNNMLLVDGGMVNNFPTDICREMGADIIIGVELSKASRPTCPMSSPCREC